MFTSEEFGRLAISGEEPVVAQIVADGVVLLGSLPQATVGVA
ncbi:hypothetical protein [Tessaracoccus sp. OS52]|nr:hypothetical protein [Tessaracoccus sp. OS52]